MIKMRNTNNPYKCIPIEPMIPEKVMNTGFGYPKFTDISASQEQYDNCLSAIATNNSQFAVQSVTVCRESNINVKSVSYVSKEKALESFLGRHKGDTLILRSIETVENNPFSANLDINAKSTDKFEDITRFIEASAYSSLIDIDSMGKQKITFRQNEEAINKLSNVLSVSRKIGFSVSGILALIALMVAYNTVRVAIYNSKDEIAVMQLVGASRSFIRGPFLIEGLIHGFISAVFTLLALYGILFWTGERIASAFGGLNIYTYFVSNILQISFILLVAGALLGVLSAQFATKRYLKV